MKWGWLYMQTEMESVIFICKSPLALSLTCPSLRCVFIRWTVPNKQAHKVTPWPAAISDLSHVCENSIHDVINSKCHWLKCNLRWCWRAGSAGVGDSVQVFVVLLAGFGPFGQFWSPSSALTHGWTQRTLAVNVVNKSHSIHLPFISYLGKIWHGFKDNTKIFF